ncbi:MAG: hypothetical protein AAF730_20165 [Bacteroidota bacterium]
MRKLAGRIPQIGLFAVCAQAFGPELMGQMALAVGGSYSFNLFDRLRALAACEQTLTNHDIQAAF